MKANREITNQSGRQPGNQEKSTLQGYPIYPANEDIYRKYHEEKDIDPEDISRIKNISENNNNESDRENIFKNLISRRNLDVPGSELDDAMEDIGSEDEENNYYSLGDNE